ncbi:hypothetical protein niasHT_025670 [Heterodera trifolii]|uniref:Uncharacterized protein n=1 Tax=Heterodera trifolii TaxID=157864 RepID=A0ABD2KFL4_9BILA
MPLEIGHKLGMNFYVMTFNLQNFTARKFRWSLVSRHFAPPPFRFIVPNSPFHSRNTVTTGNWVKLNFGKFVARVFEQMMAHQTIRHFARVWHMEMKCQRDGWGRRSGQK